MCREDLNAYETSTSSSLVIYENGRNGVEVRLEKDTLWLTRQMIADVFGSSIDNIALHLKNIYSEGELGEASTSEESSEVQKEGNRSVRRTVMYYNLDAIIAVGYRVNSNKATRFRMWATNILRKHLIDGYTLNEKRMKEGGNNKYLELRKAVDLLGNLVALESVAGETRGVAQVITEYARALDLLDDYDYQRLKVPKGTRKETFNISLENARNVIEEMRNAYGGSSLMGREKDKSLQGALGALYQTFGGKDVYPTVEEKAAHLLYFITKNHSFVDGNKRIAAALFVYYLDRNNLLTLKSGARRISDTTLVALTLLIAASKPQEKDMMIKIILNLMK